MLKVVHLFETGALGQTSVGSGREKSESGLHKLLALVRQKMMRQLISVVVVLQILAIGNSNMFAFQSGTIISLLVRLYAVCVFVILPHSCA